MYVLSLNFVILLFSVSGNAQVSSSASAFAGSSSPNLLQRISSFSNSQPSQLPKPLPKPLPSPQDPCIPDKSSLNVTLARGGELNRCTISPTNESDFSKREFKKQPKSVQFRYANETGRYTLLVYATSEKLTTNYLVWVVSNIKGSDLKKGDVDEYVRCKYIRAPRERNEKQTYEYVLFAETVENQKVHVPETRDNWNLAYFLTKQPNVLRGPIAVTNGRTKTKR